MTTSTATANTNKNPTILMAKPHSPSISTSSNAVMTVKAREEGERKEVDSPLTTQTDVSSSYDEEQSLMTPPVPMTSRLGRVIISSCSSSTDGSRSELTGDTHTSSDNDNESRTSSHRGLTMRRSRMKSSQPHTDAERATDDDPSQAVLIRALSQLHRLATLDSTEYQQGLLENTLPTLQTEPPHSLYCPTLKETGASSSKSTTPIFELSQPLQTPLVQLSMEIHRLHAAVANITREVDGHTDEVQELQSQLAVLKRRNKQVETAAKKVHKQNLKLKQQAQKDRKMVHGLKHKVHQYEAQLESQGFQLLASKVQQHEIQLQLSKSQHTSNNNNQNNNNSGSEDGRERQDSNMSEFLDIADQESHNSSDDHSESLASTTQAGSPKKSDTLPTFTFSKEKIVAPDGTITVSSELPSPGEKDVHPPKSDSSPKKPTTEESAKEKPKAENASGTATETKGNASSFSNRFAKFLGARAIANYNLKIVPPCNIQFVDIPLNKNNESPGTTNGSTSTSTTGQMNASSAAAASSSPNAFAVCGLNGFNTNLNMKPTVGARLTKINGNLVDDQWSLERLYNELEKATGGGGAKKPVVLTFRNETWNAAQTKAFYAGARKAGKSSSKGAAASSGLTQQKQLEEEKNNNNNITHKGASLFESGHHRTTSSLSTAPELPDGETTTAAAAAGAIEDSPIQRARTASADSVGKAIDGIGNFLQNLTHNNSEGEQNSLELYES